MRIVGLIVAAAAALFFAVMGTCCVQVIFGGGKGDWDFRSIAWFFLPIWVLALFFVGRFILRSGRRL